VTGSLGDDARCTACGRQQGASARFCRYCGVPFGASPEAADSSGPQSGRADSPAGWAPFVRRPAFAISAVAVVLVAVLVLAGWRAHWPAALFAAKKPPVAQAGAAAGIRSSPGATSLAPSSPAASAAPTSPAAGTSPATSTSPATGTSPAVPAPATGPAGSGVAGPEATVKAYFAAIDRKSYQTAWRLGGDNAGVSYAAFAAGFDGTARDALKVLSVTGDLVAARLTAYQTDGAVKTFQGEYTVEGGAIAQFDVQQVG
jgi:hypothetical protein